MHARSQRILVGCALLVVAVSLGWAQGDLPAEVYSTPGPHVVVNGAVLHAPVQTLNGSLLLPMRAVFEALQAEVRWFPAAQQITATRGTTVVQLWINRRVAIVGDKEVTLAVAPTLFGDTTYVPLRFPAEAFGGEVKWNDTLRTAIITIAPLDAGMAPGTETPNPPTPQNPPAPVNPPPPAEPVTPAEPPAPANPPAPQPAERTGTLNQIYPDAAQAILFQDAAGGDPALLQVAADAQITRGPAGAESAAATLKDLQPGDLVTVTPNEAGKLVKVVATYSQAKGKVAAIAQGKLLLKDGTVYQLRADVKVTDTDGNAVALNDLAAERDVTVQVTPGTDVVWAITTPAAVAPPPVAPPADEQPKILTVGAIYYTKPLKAGDQLGIQVVGTPGADAVTAHLGNAIKDIALTEEEPGKYTGQITIGGDINVTNVPISASLSVGGKRAPRARSTETITIDNTAPVLTAPQPAEGTAVLDRSPVIRASFDDGNGSGVDPTTISVRINGRPAGGWVQSTDHDFSLHARNLPLGVVRVRVEVADRAGNIGALEWRFTVVAPAVAAGPAMITAMSHDAAAAVRAGQQVKLSATLGGPPARLEWYLANKLIGTSVQREGTTLRYSMTYTIAPDDPVGDAPVSVRFFDAEGHMQTLVADRRITITAAPVLARKFKLVAPMDGTKAPAEITVSGEARPGAKVRVTVSYDGHALILPMQGDMFKGTVIADADGKWVTQAIDMSAPLVKVDSYTVKAELLNRVGEVAETLIVKLK